MTDYEEQPLLAHVLTSLSPLPIRVLSSSLLTCLDDFVHVHRWPNLENVRVHQRRMLRHELYRMIHVPRLEDKDPAELFFRFRIWSIRSGDFAVFPIQRPGIFR